MEWAVPLSVLKKILITVIDTLSITPAVEYWIKVINRALLVSPVFNIKWLQQKKEWVKGQKENLEIEW